MGSLRLLMRGLRRRLRLVKVRRDSDAGMVRIAGKSKNCGRKESPVGLSTCRVSDSWDDSTPAPVSVALMGLGIASAVLLRPPR